MMTYEQWVHSLQSWSHTSRLEVQESESSLPHRLPLRPPPMDLTGAESENPSKHKAAGTVQSPPAGVCTAVVRERSLSLQL